MGDAPELDHLLGSGDYGEVDPSRGHAAGGGGFRCADGDRRLPRVIGLGERTGTVL